MSLLIEIFQNNNTPIPRTVKTKKGDQTFYHIPACVDMGGIYPVEFRFPVESATHIYAPGKYTLSESSYKVGQFGDLEIDRFNMTLIPVRDEQKKAV